MSDFISFDRISQYPIHFVLTRTAYNQALKLELNNVWFEQLSANKRFLVTLKQRREDMDFLFSFKGKNLICILKSDIENSNYVHFLVKAIAKEDFTQKTDALRHGICFFFTGDISIAYYNASGFFYKNGQKIEGTFAKINCTQTAEMILSQFMITENLTQQKDNYEPTPQLTEFLNLAQNYSDLEYQTEEQRAQLNAPLRYSRIKGSDYSRIHNTAYCFEVDRLDENIYPINAKVEIKNNQDEVFQATIIDTDMKGNQPTVDLLFNEQINIDLLPKIGSITLTFSSVNHEVQSSAIEKIRNGTADATYMDNILGTYTPKGFEEIDLTPLNQTLDLQKYPPNPSQKTAIFNGIRTKDAYLVMGPPGTGKTTVILEWIKYFVLQCNMRVLVSSQNNKAVDNVLERIIQEDNIDVLRIGSESKVASGILPCLFENKLADLRQNIDNATQNNISSLRNYILLWEKSKNILQNLKPVYIRINDLVKELEISTQNLYKIWNQLLQELLNCQNCQNKISDISKNINILIDKEEEYGNKNKFQRFIQAPISWKRKQTISKHIALYDSYRKEESAFIQTCSDIYTYYRNIFNNIMENIYIPNISLKEKIDEALYDMYNILLDKSDPWLIFNFNHYTQQDPYTYSFSQNLTTDLEASIHRASALLDSISKWRTHAINTNNYTLKNILLESVNLVGATCIGINSQKRFADLKFDVTIIDESGQIQIHNALVPMSVSDKLIMLGDHKQIPPITDPGILEILEEHEISDELMKKSLFEVMYQNLPETNKSMLDTQFRMPGEIADILSDWFYESKYKSHETKRELISELPELSNKPFLIIDTSDSERRYEYNYKQTDGQIIHTNPLEAEIATEIVATLYRKGYPLKDIGIIAALKAQVSLIRSLISKKGISNAEAVELVATLDSYQGQERKIIIYSFGRSSKKSPEENGIGFLTELRRLNVAMSRCKKTLIMIGDMKFLSARNSIVDYKKNPISDANQTERNFSKFIQHMLSHVEKGSGEKISCYEFEKRLKKWLKSLNEEDCS